MPAPEGANRVNLTAVCAAVCALLFGGCSHRVLTAIRVDSWPQGAEVFVDGMTTGLRTPTEVDLEADSVNVEVRKEGFASMSRPVRRVEEVFNPTTLELVTQTLCAPCCLGIPAIPLLVEVAEPVRYYAPLTLRFQLQAEGAGALLEPAADVAPEVIARVTVDGADAGEWRPAGGPKRLDLVPGTHGLRIEADGRRPVEVSLTTREGAFDVVPCPLARLGQGLTVTASPGAKLRVDQGEWHEVEALLDLPLPPGEHLLELDWSGTGCARSVTLPTDRWLTLHFDRPAAPVGLR